MAALDLNHIRTYGNIELLARQMVEGFITGLHKSPYHGFSVEFAEHRLYNPGESTKYIDWKVYAKTDRLYVKRFEEETNLRAMIVLDNSSSMYYPQQDLGKITFSTFAAAALSYMLQKQRDAVGLTTFSDDIEIQTRIKSTPRHVHNILVHLERILQQKEAQKNTSVAKVLHKIADQVHKRALVIIFSDMLDNVSERSELFSALQHLKHKQHEVMLFNVHDKKTELDFDFTNRPHRFIDLESGEEVKVQPAQVKDYYQSLAKQQQHELLLKSGQYKIDMIDVDIAQNIDQILLPYLSKRARMA